MEAGPLFCNREFPCTLLGITIGFDYGHQVEGGLRPELPRFAGIIVYMLFRDAQQHISLMFMCTMANMKFQSV